MAKTDPVPEVKHWASQWKPVKKEDQWKGYDMIIEEDVTQEARFIAAANEGRNVFLTGMAGTGKSHLLRTWMASRKWIGNEGPIAITAPTGIAALNVEGMTINRWAGLFLGPKADMTDSQCMAKAWPPPKALERIQRCEVLVIDEISMMSGRLLDYLNHVMKTVRKRSDAFGGVQVIFLGDFLQLPPVKTDQNAGYDWAFRSVAWEDADLYGIELNRQYRQQEADFLSALSGMRMGNIRTNHWLKLKDRVVFQPPENLTRLMVRNNAVDRWNRIMLDEISETERTYVATTRGDSTVVDRILKSMKSPKELVLKEGAVVMITKNLDDVTPNGILGTVRDMGDMFIEVELKGGRMYSVPKVVFADDPKRPEDGSVIQFPLRLAYAITIHKAQGMTMDSVYVNINNAIEPGQAYVALSRVKTMGGLYLADWPKGIWTSDEAIAFHRSMDPNYEPK
jgi:ATP-dependent DNA helicase PIF1